MSAAKDYIYKVVNSDHAATVGVLAIAWAVLGIAAFIYSLMCIPKTPTLLKGIFGVLLSVLLGPLYWVYWYVDKGYCRGSA